MGGPQGPSPTSPGLAAAAFVGRTPPHRESGSRAPKQQGGSRASALQTSQTARRKQSFRTAELPNSKAEAELPHSKGCRSALQLSCRGLFIPWPKTHDHEKPQRLCRPEGQRYSQTARRKQSFRTPNVANSRRRSQISASLPGWDCQREHALATVYLDFAP